MCTKLIASGKALLVDLAIANQNKFGNVYGKALLVGLVTHYIWSTLFKIVEIVQQGLGKSMSCLC